MTMADQGNAPAVVPKEKKWTEWSVVGMSDGTLPKHGQYRCVEGTQIVMFEDGFMITPRHPSGYFGYLDRQTGYRKVSVRRRPAYIHRLVFSAFVGPIPKGLEIDHIDGSRTNNHLSNLRVVTKRENAVGNPVSVKRRLAASRANIKVAKAARIRPVVGSFPDGTSKEFKTMREAARLTGACEQSISKACRGLIKQAGGYKWNYSR